MDQSFGGSMQLRRELKVKNQKEERDLQHKLNMLDKQFRYTRKMLQQRRDSMRLEQRRVLMVRVCEPKATVNVAMRDILEFRNTEANLRGPHTADGRRLYSSTVSKPSRSLSATAPPNTSIERHRGNIQSSLSFRQMRNIATIDSISERESTQQQQRAREEAERLRCLQRDMLHNRMEAFIEKLREKGNMHAEPLQTK